MCHELLKTVRCARQEKEGGTVEKSVRSKAYSFDGKSASKFYRCSTTTKPGGGWLIAIAAAATATAAAAAERKVKRQRWQQRELKNPCNVDFTIITKN